MRIPSTPRTLTLGSNVEWSFITMDSPNPPNIVTRIPATPRKVKMAGRIVQNRLMHSEDFEMKLRAATRRLTFEPNPPKKLCLHHNITPSKLATVDKDSGLGCSMEADALDYAMSTPASSSAKAAKDVFQRECAISPLKTFVKRKLVDDYEFLQSYLDDQVSFDVQSAD